MRDGGLLEQAIFALTIEAKPQDIPASIEVDVSELAIGDQVRVSDLPLPPGVVTTVDPETLVVNVAAPRVAVEGEGEGVEGEGVEGEAGAPAEGGEPAGEGGEE